MGYQIIKQPDGRLAVFSSGTDSWVVLDADDQEVEDFFFALSMHDAFSRLRTTRENIRAVREGRARDAYYQFAMTWGEANRVSSRHGGSANEIRKKCAEQEPEPSLDTLVDRFAEADGLSPAEWREWALVMFATARAEAEAILSYVYGDKPAD